jgi:hypothetical protein
VNVALDELLGFDGVELIDGVGGTVDVQVDPVQFVLVLTLEPDCTFVDDCPSTFVVCVAVQLPVVVQSACTVFVCVLCLSLS